MKTTKRIERDARRLFRLCLQNGSLDEPRLRAVVQGVSDAKRREGPALLGHLHRLTRLDRDRHAALIETAVPLTPDMKAELEAEVTRQYGPATRVTFTETPALIGGMRIKVGDDVYDGSVRAALASLEQSFEPGRSRSAR
jgi:F-type H+-transporting ATPase subunit delta